MERFTVHVHDRNAKPHLIALRRRGQQQQHRRIIIGKPPPTSPVSPPETEPPHSYWDAIRHLPVKFNTPLPPPVIIIADDVSDAQLIQYTGSNQLVRIIDFTSSGGNGRKRNRVTAIAEATVVPRMSNPKRPAPAASSASLAPGGSSSSNDDDAEFKSQTCCICWESVERHTDIFWIMPCGHLMCRKCASYFLTPAIIASSSGGGGGGRGSGSVPCPMCRLLISTRYALHVWVTIYSPCQPILDPTQRASYIQISVAQMKRHASFHPRRIDCHASFTAAAAASGSNGSGGISNRQYIDPNARHIPQIIALCTRLTQIAQRIPQPAAPPILFEIEPSLLRLFHWIASVAPSGSTGSTGTSGDSDEDHYIRCKIAALSCFIHECYTPYILDRIRARFSDPHFRATHIRLIKQLSFIRNTFLFGGPIQPERHIAYITNTSSPVAISYRFAMCTRLQASCYFIEQAITAISHHPYPQSTDLVTPSPDPAAAAAAAAAPPLHPL